MRHYLAQRSRDWFALRLGKVTSTRMRAVAHGTMLAQTKLLDEMQWEVENPDEAVDKAIEGFGYRTPSSIRLGREREDWLIARYGIRQQQQTGSKITIDRPGFVTHDSIPEFGCSPDWIAPLHVGEGKTRVDATKHEHAIKHGLLAEDKDQVYCHMMCCGIPRAHYVSFCPEFPDQESQLVIIEIAQDQLYSNFLYAELHRFLQHFYGGTRSSAPGEPAGVPNFYED